MQSCPGEQDLFGVEHHDFGAEATANEGGDYPHLVFRKPQHCRKAVADGDGGLGRVPDRQVLGFVIPTGDDAAVFHRRGRAAIVVQSAANDQIGLGLGTRPVPFGLGHACIEVVPQIIVDKGRGTV